MFLPGRQIRVEHTVELSDYDISEWLKQSPQDIRELYFRSVRCEEKAFETLQASMKNWETVAVATRKLELAMKYLEIDPVEHTGNKWVEDEKGQRTISNMVYKMTCSITENTRWNLWSSSALNKRWHVEWQVVFNTPKPHHYIVIAGKERKYSDRYDADNYLNGRIRAFAKYFKEISPPIPADYKYAFTESGMLLPGYRVEGEEPKQEKDSVLGKLSEAKSQQKAAPAAPFKKKKEPEI